MTSGQGSGGAGGGGGLRGVPDDDLLDGMCDDTVDPATPDELLPWVVLFATCVRPALVGLDGGAVFVVDDPGALARRAAEWRALFSSRDETRGGTGA